MLFGCFWPFFAQEFTDEKKSIPAENREMNDESFFIERLDWATENPVMGPFDVRRYKVPINLMDIGLPKEKKPNVDILAISKAKEHYRKARIPKVELTRQSQQIRSEVKVFADRRFNSWNRSTDDTNWDSKRMRDGGIKNRAMRDIRQPFIYPHGLHGRQHHYRHNGIRAYPYFY